VGIDQCLGQARRRGSGGQTGGGCRKCDSL
jgi:hypothetical protein